MSQTLNRGQVDNDRDRALPCHLACPADDELLDARIEVPLAKRERVERVKNLPDIVDTDLDARGMCTAMQTGAT